MGTSKMGAGQPRGINAGRKLNKHRKAQKHADKLYRKGILGTLLKANPFGGSSHASGIVLEKIGLEAKQPNSAIRKCVRVQLIRTARRSLPSCPTTVASTSLMRTTRCSCPVSVAPVTPRVIFRVCVSRS